MRFSGDFRRTLATPFPPLKLVVVHSVALLNVSGLSSASSAPLLKITTFTFFFFRSEPATSSERCLSSKSLLPVSLTASTLASEQTVFHLSRERTTRTKNFTMKDYSEMFPRWDGELEDEKAGNIVKAVFSSGWAWEQSHWLLVGTKLWTNVKVEILPMKTEAGQMVRSLKTVSPSRTQSDAESRKKARESPGLDVETMKGEIVRWLTVLTSNMVEGLSRCENTLKTQSRMIEGLTTQVGAVEMMVREGWKEDHTKADSSTDVPEANKSDGDKAKKDNAEDFLT
ncbi:LOW QUALITY PROTEIN: hypothetical protein YC2023_008480 [Brassica napus]